MIFVDFEAMAVSCLSSKAHCAYPNVSGAQLAPLFLCVSISRNGCPRFGRDAASHATAPAFCCRPVRHLGAIRTRWQENRYFFTR
jgi:hypothetical protein